jgi:hypothetical protein
MAYKTKKQREAELIIANEEKQKNFLATRETRFFELIEQMGQNTNIFDMPILRKGLWSEWTFELRINPHCAYYHLIEDYNTREFFKFYENEDNFKWLESEIKMIVCVVRMAIEDEEKRQTMRSNALKKLSEEEKELLGIKY